MKKRNWIKYLVPVGALLAFGSLANATIIGPGGSTSPAVITLGAGSTLNGALTIGPTDLTASTLQVTYTEWVFTDGVTGDLDFVIQANVDNTSSALETMEHITTGNFTGTGSTTTDVGYNTDLCTFGLSALSGTTTPSNIARKA